MRHQYISPILTVVEFRAERGYAFSTLQETAERLEVEMLLRLENGSGNSSNETFSYQQGWGTGDGDGFWTNGSTGGYF